MIYYTRNQGKENPPNQKGIDTMKKSSIKSLVAYLNGEAITNLDEIKAELTDELAKDEQRKADKISAYDAAWKAVRELLNQSNKPLSAAEIAAQAKLPEGFTKGKVVYALGHDWADRVIKVEGKVNEYKLKS